MDEISGKLFTCFLCCLESNNLVQIFQPYGFVCRDCAKVFPSRIIRAYNYYFPPEEYKENVFLEEIKNKKKSWWTTKGDTLFSLAKVPDYNIVQESSEILELVDYVEILGYVYTDLLDTQEALSEAGIDFKPKKSKPLSSKEVSIEIFWLAKKMDQELYEIRFGHCEKEYSTKFFFLQAIIENISNLIENELE